MIQPTDATTPPASTKPSPLAGLRVLVVENDYYLAMDAKTALEGAGAEVIGPVSTLEQFQAAMAEAKPDCAVVDINLGDGPTFSPARRLEDEGVPFLFSTGYSPEATPADLRHIDHARKPVKADDLVKAVGRLRAWSGTKPTLKV